jgi:hypothetical protein
MVVVPGENPILEYLVDKINYIRCRTAFMATRLLPGRRGDLIIM